MELEWPTLLGLAVTSGMAAGIANQVFRFGHDWLAGRRTAVAQQRDLEHKTDLQERELRHRRDIQREEREHQAALRKEDMFFSARTELLPEAVAVRDWIHWWWGDLHGADADYYQIHVKAPRFQDVADAIAALRRIAGEHPSRAVRIHARELAESIDSVVNMPDPNGSAEPRTEDLSSWFDRANGLVEGLHDPDYECGSPTGG